VANLSIPLAYRKSRYRRRERSTAGYVWRLILMVVALAVVLWYGLRQFNELINRSAPYTVPVEERFYLPATKPSCTVIHHEGFSLCYNEEYEQAEWVAYVLTRTMLKQKNVPRTDWFEEDPKVKTGSATYFDYKGSGYTRGHLVPAADMAHSTTTMRESFYMSNISPQKRAFNAGIWHELERQIRQWVYDKEMLYIVTGPVLREVRRFVGRNRVGIPSHFYKIVLDYQEDPPQAIAFVLPNELSTRPLREYVVTVDSVERLTGIDFFAELMLDSLEERVESQVDTAFWKFDKKLYTLRIEKWNHR